MALGHLCTHSVKRARTKTTTVYAWFDPVQAKSALTGPLKSRVDKQVLPGTGANPGLFLLADASLVDVNALKQLIALARGEKARAAVRLDVGLQARL